MKRKHPTILKVMTPFPYFIDAGASLPDAASMMKDHGFHHLPVKDDEELIGVISERDIFLARAAGDRGEVELDVGAVCRREVLIVDVGRSLASTVREMARRHFDAALVTRDDHLAGIITTTDACLLLAELLDPNIADEIA